MPPNTLESVVEDKRGGHGAQRAEQAVRTIATGGNADALGGALVSGSWHATGRPFNAGEDRKSLQIYLIAQIYTFEL